MLDREQLPSPTHVIRPDQDQCTGADRPMFSIATLVTNPDEYAEMQRSFATAGFTGATCEFIAIDNSGARQFCAYAGLNRALNAARGRYVILCHQDVRTCHDVYEDLVTKLESLTEHDPSWAVAGNAGGKAPGQLAIRITDPHGADQNSGCFPERVLSIDENFIIVRGDSRFGLSADLDGFHLYGADLCLSADIAGHSAYVIDFHLTHLSPGRKDAKFFASEAAFRSKWTAALRPRWVQTTCTLMRLSGGKATRTLETCLPASISALPARIVQGLIRRWPKQPHKHITNGSGIGPTQEARHGV